MIISFLIKTALLGAGMTIDSVLFDKDKECIYVNYKQQGKDHIKVITFQEIEDLFRTAPPDPADTQKLSARASAAPSDGDLAPGHTSPRQP